jgi:hypothetical protein
MNEYIFPNEHVYQNTSTHSLVVEQLQQKAKSLNLHNFWLHVRTRHENVKTFLTYKREDIGSINTIEFALLMEVVSRSDLAMQIMNCQPWDIATMMMLRSLGTEKQRVDLLQPMLEGKFKLLLTLLESHSDMTFYQAKEPDADQTSTDITYLVSGQVHAITPISEQHKYLLVPKNVHTHFLVAIDAPGITVSGLAIDLQNVQVADEVSSPNVLVLQFAWYCRLLAQSDELFRVFCRNVKIKTSNPHLHYHDLTRSRIELDRTRLMLLSVANDIDRYSSDGEEGRVLKRNLDVVKLEVIRTCQKIVKRARRLGNVKSLQDELGNFSKWFMVEGGAKEIENISSIELLRANL